MKNKSTIFLSAALTAFVLVMITSVIAVVRNAANLAGYVMVVEPTLAGDPTLASDPTPQTISVSATTQPIQVGPEQAASIAAKMLGRQDLFSVETTNLDGVSAYKVTFANGDLVYVGMDGQILSISLVPPAPSLNNVVNTVPVQVPKPNQAKPEHSQDDDGHADDDGGGGDDD